MEEIVAKIQEAEALAKAKQAELGRGVGGQELSYSLTRLREARLFLADVPTETPFTEKKPA